MKVKPRYAARIAILVNLRRSNIIKIYQRIYELRIYCIDGWLLAGHLNDVCVLAPIFYKGKVVAFSACTFQHGDIGGKVSADDSEVYEEGIFLPPVKLINGGVDNSAEFDIVQGGYWTY